MKVVFDAALDGRAWPGPLGHAEFSYGEVWVGPMGLLDLLESRLGLGGRFETELQRACGLSLHLRGSAGFWRKSYEVDPLGTCRRLLRDRDVLRLGGWVGQPVSARLAELHEITAAVAPGVPERLVAISHALTLRSPDIGSVLRFTALEHLPPLWREVFGALQRAGVEEEVRPLEPAATSGDLAAARTAGFSPRGDGRLCLLRRHGPMDTADEIAAALAACDRLEDVVIVGADDVLEQALHRHGLPRVGAAAGAPASARLLNRVIETAFQPMEISELHALLTADVGPIPRRVAAPLIEALQRFPGRGNPGWNEARDRGLSRCTEQREEIERRVTTLLAPACHHDEALPLADLRKRLGVLAAWARSRITFQPTLEGLARRIDQFLDAVERTGASALHRHELRRLLTYLGEPGGTGQPAEAGLAHVPHPGAILGPARTIVWWNFTRESVLWPSRLWLTRTEREGLRAAGLEPPDAAHAMAIETDAWQRPFTQATEALVLACPRTDARGEASQPHPAWDDITANLADHGTAQKLERSILTLPAPARFVAVPARALVAPAPLVPLATPLDLREVESPSSIEKLLGCSLAWALQYRGGLYSGRSAAPPRPGPLVFGLVAHELLQQVLDQNSTSADEAADRAGEMFDQQCANLCEDLALSQHQAERATLRRAIVESARELVRLQRKHGARHVRTEIDGETVAVGVTLRGRLDLVWEDPDVVLDLKWGKGRQLEKLTRGTAIQLAAYAAMRAGEGHRSETAYFVLLNQHLLAEPGGVLAQDARELGSQRAADTWSATRASLEQRRQSLAAGQLEAPGAEGTKRESAFSPAGLQVAPPCTYCDYAGLCGRGGAR